MEKNVLNGFIKKLLPGVLAFFVFLLIVLAVVGRGVTDVSSDTAHAATTTKYYKQVTEYTRASNAKPYVRRCCPFRRWPPERYTGSGTGRCSCRRCAWSHACP